MNRSLWDIVKEREWIENVEAGVYDYGDHDGDHDDTVEVDDGTEV